MFIMLNISSQYVNMQIFLWMAENFAADHTQKILLQSFQ